MEFKKFKKEDDYSGLQSMLIKYMVYVGYLPSDVKNIHLVFCR